MDEDLVTYADPLLSLNKSSRGTVAVHPDEMEVRYFEPLIGTRHKDPDNDLIYETTEIKIDHQGYIVAYRRVVTKGQLTGRPDGPFHVGHCKLHGYRLRSTERGTERGQSYNTCNRDG